MSDKKVCEVCGREKLAPPLPGAKWDDRKCAGFGETHWRLGYERKAAILTPEVLRLIEAGREYSAAYHDEGRDDRPEVALLLQAALALPFEKPANKRNG